MAGGAKAHLQRVQQGRQSGRSGHGHAQVTLQRLEQAGTADHLGVQPLGGQEQQGEVGGVGRPDVLVADAPCLVALLQRRARGVRSASARSCASSRRS